jgi:hypothetical protein
MFRKSVRKFALFTTFSGITLLPVTKLVSDSLLQATCNRPNCRFSSFHNRMAT